MRVCKRVLPVLLALLLFVSASYGAAWLLVPARQGYGAQWDAYLQEEEGSLDVLFFGSSIVYCDVVPALIWERAGLRSFVLAGPAQPLSITYYYIREACKTQDPQAVVVELSGLFFEKYPGHTKSNLAYMPWSENRLLATLKGAEREELLGALFPLYYYHDRVFTIAWEELRQRLRPQADPLAGYTLMWEVAPQSGELVGDASAQTQTYQENLDYLKKIAAFCKKRGLRLILYLAPTYEKVPQEALETLEADARAIVGEDYFNCNGPDWPQADPETGWCDFLHYNVYGAMDYSRHLGTVLARLGLEASGEDAALWQERLAYFYEQVGGV
jgi:hypothetical protein